MKLFKTILRVVLVLSIIVFTILAIINRQNRSCSGVEVSIDYKGENNILSEQDIVQLISSAHIKTTNQKLKSIPLEKIKKVLNEEIYIKKINKIYFSGTKLMVDVTLREMLLHVFPLNQSPFFVDMDGVMIPNSAKIKEKLIIVNGSLNTHYKQLEKISTKEPVLNSIYQIAAKIKNDP
ncbi:MAG TPA: hypothetical protein PLM70_07725, partial [Bacteroidales bacterium]|nr:hypothetical protein [Bacteroidales bacterium]